MIRLILLNSTTWTKERREIYKECKKAGRGRSGMFKQIMGSRKATPVVLGFIDATRTGQTAQNHEQEREKQERKGNEI